MKKILLIFSFLIHFISNAQEKLEFGIIGGVNYYMGDVNPNKLFYSPQLAYGLIIKHNFNENYSLKTTGISGVLTGNDADFNNLYQKIRNHSFSTKYTEIASQLEFSFFPFNSFVDKKSISPYVSAGVALLVSEDPYSPKFKLAIPFGIGLKYAPSNRITVSLEWNYKKTFTDYLDALNYNDIKPDNLPINNKQNTYKNSKDWYSFAGISITYKFAANKNSCPAYARRH